MTTSRMRSSGSTNTFAHVERIKRFAILDRELTQETGELAPTQKARVVVYAKFEDVIDSIYQ